MLSVGFLYHLRTATGGLQWFDGEKGPPVPLLPPYAAPCQKGALPELGRGFKVLAHTLHSWCHWFCFSPLRELSLFLPENRKSTSFLSVSALVSHGVIRLVGTVIKPIFVLHFSCFSDCVLSKALQGLSLDAVCPCGTRRGDTRYLRSTQTAWGTWEKTPGSWKKGHKSLHCLVSLGCYRVTSGMFLITSSKKQSWMQLDSLGLGFCTVWEIMWRQKWLSRDEEGQ